MAVDPYDYRLTVEFKDGKTMSTKFLSAVEYEEGQLITIQAKRCLVSQVTPVSDARPGGPRIVNVHCLALDD